MRKKSILLFLTAALTLLCNSCNDKNENYNDGVFSKDQIGVCSWSWKSDMNSILDAMNEMDISGMQLATTPWVAGDLSDAQKEIFGYEESEEVLNRIRSLSASGKINIMSTMICFPHEDYTSMETIYNTSGFLFTEDSYGHDADEEWETNSELLKKAAQLTASLGVRYLSTEVGFVKKNWNLALERVKYACDVCSDEGVVFLIESGQESGEDMVKFLEDLKAAYPGTEIGVNFDPANHILYGTDTPTNAYNTLLPWIRQIHIKDAVLDESLRKSWSEDVVWGNGDVSTTFNFLHTIYHSGYTGNLVVEHESGDNRIADIEVALKALLTYSE